jgi:small GTP-binding protein
VTDSGQLLKAKICMLGAFAVGKTSLVSRFVHTIFSEKYHTTIGVKIDKKSLEVGGRKLDLMVWDLAGEDDFQTVRMSYLRGAAGYLLVIDGIRPATVDTAVDLQQRAEKAVGKLPFCVLVNKSDLIHEWQLNDGAIALPNNWNVRKTSAKLGTGVNEAFHDLALKIVAHTRAGKD